MLNKLPEHLTKLLPKIKKIESENSTLIVTINLKDVISFLTFIKNHTHMQYKLLSDLCIVDYPENRKRFKVVYNFLSVRFNSRLMVKLDVKEYEQINSITRLFKNADWFEREAWDMFGVFFSGHSDLRRILSDYGFEGHPLRKDFPLSGYTEVRYSESLGRVVYENVNVSQDYRFFKFKKPGF